MNSESTDKAVWQIDSIIKTANDLRNDEATAASISAQIAGAFVLNRMDLLPSGCNDIIEAWDRLDDWQEYVRKIKCKYMHFIIEA